MNIYRIFLASSNELLQDRLEFAAFVLNYNKELKKYGIQLELEWWEDMDDHFSTSCKQNDYNEYLKECHFFILLFWTKVGKYTKAEFDLAYSLYAQKGLPYVYCYQKECAKGLEQASKKEFIDSINQPGSEQFETLYADLSKVTEQFRKNFQRRLDNPDDKNIQSGTQKARILSENAAEDPLVFLGREEELKKIRARLNSGGRLMLINAEGGIGKTTLAAKYWNQSLHDYKHAAWLFCEKGIMNSLRELAPKLNVDLSNLDEAAQLKALKKALSDLQYDFLLVLDNANTESDIKVFRQEFEGFHWHVLITSRCRNIFDGEQEMHIMHLPPPLAKELFCKYYREDTEEFEELLDRLMRAIEYHTLLIEIFAKNLKKARRLTLKEFLDSLEQKGLFLEEDNFSINTEYNIARKKGVEKTNQIIEILYDFSQIEEEERFLLVNLALLPAENYKLDFLESLFADNTRSAVNQLNTILEKLNNGGWIGGTVSENYRLSPVIQKLVLEKNQSSLSQDTEPLLDRLNYILETDGYDLLNINLTAARPYVVLVHHINTCLKKHPNESLAAYIFCTGIYFDNTGKFIEAQKSYLNYQDIFQKLLISSPENLSYKNSLAISYSKLGGIYEQSGDWKNALLNYEERNKIGKEIYASSPENLSYKNGLAISYSKLGGIYEQTGDWKNALLNYEEDFRITKEIYASSPENLSYKNGLAISVARLGTFYLKQNDMNRSLQHFLESRTLFFELWQVTEGQIVNFTFYFALNTHYVTRIVKFLIQNNHYEQEHVVDITESINAMRQEAYSALQALWQAEILQENQKWLIKELGDESWYGF